MKLFATKEGKIYGGLFLFVGVLYLALQMIGVGGEDNTIKQETKTELYQKFSNLMEDVFETSERGLYDTYVSKHISKEDHLVLWDTYFDYLDQYELDNIPDYEKQDVSFSKKVAETSTEDGMEEVDVHEARFQITILVEGEQIEVPLQFKWVNEDDHWKVYEMKMPRDLKDPGMMKRVFRGS